MALNIATFTNTGWRPGNNAGGATLFKALGHPLTAEAARDFLVEIAGAGPVAVYDPLRQAEDFDSFYNLAACDLAGVYVQDLDDVGAGILGHAARPVTALPQASCATVLVCAFDASRLGQQIRHLLPAGVRLASFDDLRLPESMISVPGTYLDPLNFATNFAFLMEGGGHHTRIQLVNYWGTYGAADPALWLCLFDAEGRVLARWTEPLPKPGAVFTLDSEAIAERFGLGAFTGSLFLHAIRIAGHDVVKYVIDTYGTRPEGLNGSPAEPFFHLSGTHDANAWPADLYAGLPAPAPGESVRLLIQNSHPVTIPDGAVTASLMGSPDRAPVQGPIPPFGLSAVDMNSLLPDAAWPDQIEVQAGRYFVRPRYAITDSSGRIRFGHMNVERTDLSPDPRIPDLEPLIGKGYILPLPLLPLADFATELLPTPMSTAQETLPLGLAIYDASGQRVVYRSLGCLARRDSLALAIDALLAEAGESLPGGYGHLELLYDFSDGGSADGWLHALVRFSRRQGRGEGNGPVHVAETTFGAHIYNIPLTYRSEPQSYTTRPPGLTTRLVLRLGGSGLRTLCHLIYPASMPWHPRSATRLTAFDAGGCEVASRDIAIPCGGSLFWTVETLFGAATADQCAGGYVIIRDTTCRLFGFHGLEAANGAFSLDHTFGF